MKQGRLLFAIDQQRYDFVDNPPASPMTALGQYYCMAVNDRRGSILIHHTRTRTKRMDKG